ncbi:hypothetical protein ACFCXS_34875 [Streptomyces sp. NPDC056373]|uniref:hypothetical protein n=1 Tax=Streptomyces sp. NPDC056373 TaxID=3345798 RepID=UPI0035E1FE95
MSPDRAERIGGTADATNQHTGHDEHHHNHENHENHENRENRTGSDAARRSGARSRRGR